ncbi:MAG TPA: energy-coupling factor ABC transporter permease [bacterium]|nr:energy-coupling factor ABC transporter permease [bacterium]
MHMADALLSPAVGVAFLAASGAGIAYSAKKVREEADEKKVPLMGVMGAFVFAAQMINFSIPGTGSSGHLGGGMLLAMVLGPYAAFLTIASVLIVQALIFADGGILALGANIWNMGFYPCVVGFLIYRLLAGKAPGFRRLSLGAAIGTLIALELGAFSVVIETLLSGRSELPFGKFCALMLGIHFPIAIIEGVVTVAVVGLVFRIRPEVVKASLGLDDNFGRERRPLRPVIVSMFIAALLVSGVVAWFASAHPDGLEWSINKITGATELSSGKGGLEEGLSGLQQKTAILPDYAFKKDQAAGEGPESAEQWPAPSRETSVSGVFGSMLVLGIAAALALVLVKVRGKAPGE